MKKVLMTFIIITLSLSLAGCTQSFISETGQDVSELERCIDDMVSAGSNQECSMEDRENLIEEYIRSFETQFTTHGNDTINALEFSTSKSGDISRLENWFQYVGLPEEEGEANYDTYKGIAQTMLSEIREMNSEPEIIFSSEYLFEGHLIYKYHTDKNDQISGEVLWLNHLEDFASSFGGISDFLVEVADDEDLVLQTFTITTNEHSFKIYVHPIDNTYSYEFYHTNTTDGITIEQAGIIIETAFASSGLTLIDE